MPLLLLVNDSVTEQQQEKQQQHDQQEAYLQVLCVFKETFVKEWRFVQPINLYFDKTFAGFQIFIGRFNTQFPEKHPETSKFLPIDWA